MNVNYIQSCVHPATRGDFHCDFVNKYASMTVLDKKGNALEWSQTFGCSALKSCLHVDNRKWVLEVIMQKKKLLHSIAQKQVPLRGWGAPKWLTWSTEDWSLQLQLRCSISGIGEQNLVLPFIRAILEIKQRSGEKNEWCCRQIVQFTVWASYYLVIMSGIARSNGYLKKSDSRFMIWFKIITNYSVSLSAQSPMCNLISP